MWITPSSRFGGFPNNLINVRGGAGINLLVFSDATPFPKKELNKVDRFCGMLGCPELPLRIR